MHIGKGLCVALIIVQIPGASGLYPIEMDAEILPHGLPVRTIQLFD